MPFSPEPAMRTRSYLTFASLLAAVVLGLSPLASARPVKATQESAEKTKRSEIKRGADEGRADLTRRSSAEGTKGSAFDALKGAHAEEHATKAKLSSSAASKKGTSSDAKKL